MSDMRIYDIRAALSKVCEFAFDVEQTGADLFKVTLSNKFQKTTLKASFFIDCTPSSKRSFKDITSVKEFTVSRYEKCKKFLMRQLGILPDLTGSDVAYDD